jgi:AraC family transcriptional regulator
MEGGSISSRNAWEKLQMAQHDRFFAAGEGWSASDVICDSGPGDPRFEERHEAATLAMVLDGGFQYRSARGATLLAPGAVLLGNVGEDFECGHDYGTGDRCLSFHFAEDYLDAIAADVLHGGERSFVYPGLPPETALAPLFAAALAGKERDKLHLEETAVGLAGHALLRQRGETAPPPLRTTAREECAIAEAFRRMETEADDPGEKQLSLKLLASRAAMTPFRFLRTFRTVVGTTPHRYLMFLRLARAGIRLRQTREEIATIAFASGFGDLSTFNRTFRRVFGTTPGNYRRDHTFL